MPAKAVCMAVRSPAVLSGVRPGDQPGVRDLGRHLGGGAAQAAQGLAGPGSAGPPERLPQGPRQSGRPLPEVCLDDSSWTEAGRVPRRPPGVHRAGLRRRRSEALQVVGRVIDRDDQLDHRAAVAAHGDGPAHLGPDQAADDRQAEAGGVVDGEAGRQADPVVANRDPQLGVGAVAARRRPATAPAGRARPVAGASGRRSSTGLAGPLRRRSGQACSAAFCSSSVITTARGVATEACSSPASPW